MRATTETDSMKFSLTKGLFSTPNSLVVVFVSSHMAGHSNLSIVNCPNTRTLKGGGYMQIKPTRYTTLTPTIIFRKSVEQLLCLPFDNVN